jgi:cation diffusion facilitator CzcD-associated flavoprotein CzcO
LVLDAGQTVGGTWSKERLYDGLVTNNLVGMFEYSDFPIDFETFGVPPGTHIPGMVVHKYLKSYAEHFGFFNKIRFQSTVKLAELKEDRSWIITYEMQKGQEMMKIKLAAKKIVLATGMTSLSSMPQIAGSEEFEGPIFHFKDFQHHKDDMKASKNILVLGGSKSAVDAAYLNASECRHVDWIIRGKKIPTIFMLCELTCYKNLGKGQPG